MFKHILMRRAIIFVYGQPPNRPASPAAHAAHSGSAIFSTAGRISAGRAWWKQSSHLTGSTVDISYKDISPESKAWLERKLRQMERQGLVEATEEHGSQACFHVMVFPSKTRK